MKKLIHLFASILISLSIFGQKNKNKDSNIPAFGVVQKADLEMKECDFDKNAEAMVIFDKGELVYIMGEGIDLERHIRIKILNDKGKDNADIRIRYHSWRNDEEVTDLSAQVYNLDPAGNIIVTKVDKKQIFQKQINKRWSEKVFTFPDVKAGSIIEYKYKRTSVGMLDWYFQRAIPVKYSEFTFDYPNTVVIDFTPRCYLPYESKNESTVSRISRHFSMSNVPALRDESYIQNEDDYLQKIETKTIAWEVSGRRENVVLMWPEVIKYLMEDEDFGFQLKKEIPRTSDLDAQLKGVSDPYKKMKIIYEYVRNNMQWNGSPGIWALDGVKSAWKDKKGTVGEINLILINLLKDAGLNAKPILVSTHDNGLVKTVDAGNIYDPGFNQFNEVLAWVTIGKETFALDATDKNTPVNLIPRNVITNEGLVIEKVETFEWGWHSLWKDNLSYKNLILMNGEITDAGVLKGQVSINSYDYARLERIPAVKKGKKEFTDKYLSSLNPGITIDSVTLENVDADTLPLVQKVYFNEQLSESGDYKYFSVNLLSGLEKNPFVADKRISDVFFGYLQNHTIIGSIALPEGYEVEALPQNVRMIMQDTSITITRISQRVENMLSYRITLEFKKPNYAAQEYDGFREFYKKLFDLLNEQFVIKKKA